jgi:hypothetical protein
MVWFGLDAAPVLDPIDKIHEFKVCAVRVEKLQCDRV